MTDFDFGSSGIVKPTRFTRTLVANTALFRSQITEQTQTAQRGGEGWLLDLVWENLAESDMQDVFGFFCRLNGAEHDVELPEYNYIRQGVVGGTPRVAGGGQTGSSLLVDGCTPNVTDWIKAGDMIRLGASPNKAWKMCTADASSDGGGT